QHEARAQAGPRQRSGAGRGQQAPDGGGPARGWKDSALQRPAILEVESERGCGAVTREPGRSPDREAQRAPGLVGAAHAGTDAQSDSSWRMLSVGWGPSRPVL